jgi:hypothetical protein
MANLIPTNTLPTNTKSSKPFSIRLINWVEPVSISGATKSGIYTEVDSNLNVGDRVFIINGNYDSDLLIKSDKYKTGRDGYKILSIDRCKIVLDIDFTGVLPWNEDAVDSFIRVYPIRDNTEFVYINKMVTSSGGTFSSRFNQYQDNVVYSDTDYLGFSGNGQNLGLTGSPGFYIKGGTGSWINVTGDFTTNFPSFLGTYSSLNSNGRIIIMNSTFTYGNMEFKEGFSYINNGGTWSVDVTYHRPIISKSNFRDGNFKGNWNAGLFGRQDKKITWEGIYSSWNTGTLLNTIWGTGSMNSIYSSTQSYFADFDKNGLPYQKVNPTNNRGFGYNYILNAEITSSIISNGIFYNSLIGTQSATFSVVEAYITSSTQSLSVNTNGGEFNACSFESANVITSSVKNSRINNSRIIRSKSTNANYTDTLFYASSYNSNNIIKILAYDNWIVNLDLSNPSQQFTTYKFYISEDNYSRMKHKDQFYINGISGGYENLNDSSKIFNFFDKKFILNDYLYHYDDVPGPTKTGIDYTVNLSTSKENQYVLSGSVSTILNTNQLPSIDVTINQTGFTTNDINITNAYIVDSDFRSGLFETSDWNSGSFINHNYDNVIPNSNIIGGVYNISITTLGDNKLTISMPSPVAIDDNLIKAGSIVYLNSIDQVDVLSNVTTLPDTYRVIAILPPRIIILEEIVIGTASSIIAGLTNSSYFATTLDSTTNLGNRYNYIHPIKINNSNVVSGAIRRSYIKNSVIYNQAYNNIDFDFTNLAAIKSLMIGEMIIRGTGNTINSGVFVYSFMSPNNDKWNNGIFYNSSWIGQTFSNGVFKSSRWENGIFNNGLFYLSNAKGGISTQSPTYLDEKFPSFWIEGNVHGHRVNNRYSWIGGIFNNGEFYKSGWENGTFNNGTFYLSDWFDGTFSNGVLGDKTISTTDTNFYNGTFNNGIVENANIFAQNTDYVNIPGPTSPKLVTWNNGIFKSGAFGSTYYNVSGYSEYSQAFWNSGLFSGGSFVSNAVWVNGTFSNGNFLSTYGSTMSSSTFSTDYSWQAGIFNGGIFGNADGLTNSTWYNGEFNGGKFIGRVWNNGVLTSGDFEGSATYSAISLAGTTCSNPYNFVNSFTSSYYGLWRSGTVTDVKDKFVFDKKIFTQIQRKFTEKIIVKQANLQNILWMSGTFSHPSGTMVNSVWLDGGFSAGIFRSSSFNPYVLRNSPTQSSFNLNDDTCYWTNGTLDSSDFYISKWTDGRFLVGTAVGMIWQNGVSNYMNAFNVFWENGSWRNGNWYGSSFILSGSGQVTDDYTRQIIFRGMSWSGTSSCHVWNIFTEEPTNTPIIANATASIPIGQILPKPATPIPPSK